MIRLAGPSAGSTPEQLADWLEAKAAIAADHNSSLQDLIQELRRSGTTEVDAGGDATDDFAGESSQRKAETAWKELDRRSSACGSGYPFVLRDAVIELDQKRSRAPYLCCLYLTVRKYDKTQLAARGTKLFERISAEAAKRYLCPAGISAETFVVGTGSTDRRGFQSQVRRLVTSIKEGKAPRKSATAFRKQDAKLDVVAWKPFPDHRPGKLIAFGQCATGENWKAKLSELQPAQWTQLWLQEPPLVKELAKMFFVPRCIPEIDWEETSTYAGIVFDRCRIAACVTAIDHDLTEAVSAWMGEVEA